MINKDYSPQILLNSRNIHEKLQGRIAERILNWTLQKKLIPQQIKVTLLGMAFKGIPETDDLRGAPSLIMINELKERGFRNIYGHDYLVPNEDINNMGIISTDIDNAFIDANVVIFMNNNPNYKKINLHQSLQKMSDPSYFMDSWNMFDHDDINFRKRVAYGSIGRL